MSSHLSSVRVIRQVQFRCLKCRYIVFQRDDDPSREHELNDCGGELRSMPFDPALWIGGIAKKMGGATARCSCGTWFVSKGELRCWSCINGGGKA